MFMIGIEDSELNGSYNATAFFKGYAKMICGLILMIPSVIYFLDLVFNWDDLETDKKVAGVIISIPFCLVVITTILCIFALVVFIISSIIMFIIDLCSMVRNQSKTDTNSFNNAVETSV